MSVIGHYHVLSNQGMAEFYCVHLVRLRLLTMAEVSVKAEVTVVYDIDEESFEEGGNLEKDKLKRIAKQSMEMDEKFKNVKILSSAVLDDNS